MLKKASDISSFFYERAANMLRRRAICQLRAYVKRPRAFMECLYGSYSLISGSFALALAMPRFQDFVGDLDVYVGQYSRTVLDYLVRVEGKLSIYNIFTTYSYDHRIHCSPYS